MVQRETHTHTHTALPLNFFGGFSKSPAAGSTTQRSSTNLRTRTTEEEVSWLVWDVEGSQLTRRLTHYRSISCWETWIPHRSNPPWHRHSQLNWTPTRTPKLLSGQKKRISCTITGIFMQEQEVKHGEQNRHRNQNSH